ncbi:hypothetical protein [Candidatus Tisiphia endosymbiont of Nemotelus uliginosus]|uniref:hypothetical protein n=1 Tax=Candidatus Tisiphia endosymbiont of Nemotelus uliginosus TaxID=3077926 RepID=UPI0035C89EAC
MSVNNKPRFRFIAVRQQTIRWLRIGILIMLLLGSISAKAEYRDPTTKTNVNKIDPFFTENIDNYPGFTQMLEEQQAAVVKGVEIKAGFNDLVGSTQVKAKEAELSNIRAEELEDAGIRESLKENWLNEYLVDYSKPGMMQHQEDATRVAEGTGKMMAGLIALLKKLDIDCKQVKGDTLIEPQYYLQLDTALERHKGDTVYEQIICEELRNKYQCTDKIEVKCVQKTARELKPTTIRLAHHEMPDHWWLGRGRDGGMCYGGIQNTTDRFAIFNNSPAVLAEVRQKIIQKTGHSDIEVPEQEIMFFSGGDGVSLAGLSISGRVVL